MKTLAILTCIYGRPALTKIVLDWTARVAEQCPFNVQLVAVGSEGTASSALAASCDWTYSEFANEPLSNKFQHALEVVEMLGETSGDLADAVMVIGSDDLVTKEILVAAMDAMDRGVDAWGLSDAFFCAPGPRCAWWPGYAAETGRAGEPMGMARTFSRRLLTILKWRLWPDGLARSLDMHAWQRIKAASQFFDVTIETCPTAATGGMAVDVKTGEGEQLTAFSAYLASGEEVDWRGVLRHFPAELVEALGLDPVPGFLARRDANRAAPKRGIVMMARDAEAGIERALRSALPVADDVTVLVDSRTTDRTADIARSLGANVFVEEWRGFGATRQRAHELSPAEFQVVLDSDEILDVNDLAAAIDQAELEDADCLRAVLSCTTVPGRSSLSMQVRVIRKGRARHLMFRHNELVFTSAAPKCVETMAVVHADYRGRSPESVTAAIVDLAKMHANPTEAGIDPNWERAHAAFHLARAYVILGDWAEARAWSKRCRELDALLEKPRYDVVVSIEAWACLILDGIESAAWFVTDALRTHIDIAELHYIMLAIHGQLYVKHGMQPGRHACHPQSCIAFLPNAPRAFALLGMEMSLRVE